MGWLKSCCLIIAEHFVLCQNNIVPQIPLISAMAGFADNVLSQIPLNLVTAGFADNVVRQIPPIPVMAGFVDDVVPQIPLIPVLAHSCWVPHFWSRICSYHAEQCHITASGVLFTTVLCFIIVFTLSWSQIYRFLDWSGDGALDLLPKWCSQLNYNSMPICTTADKVATEIQIEKSAFPNIWRDLWYHIIRKSRRFHVFEASMVRRSTL